MCWLQLSPETSGVLYVKERERQPRVPCSDRGGCSEHPSCHTRTSQRLLSGLSAGPFTSFVSQCFNLAPFRLCHSSPGCDRWNKAAGHVPASVRPSSIEVKVVSLETGALGVG